jgi:hypothetical protein
LTARYLLDIGFDGGTTGADDIGGRTGIEREAWQRVAGRSSSIGAGVIVIARGGGKARSRRRRVEAAIASNIVVVDSRMAPAGEAARRGGNTSRRIGGGGQKITWGSRRTKMPLGRFAAALRQSASGTSPLPEGEEGGSSPPPLGNERAKGEERVLHSVPWLTTKKRS